MFELLSIPAIVALVEAVKKAGIPSDYAPLIAIFSGVLFGAISSDVVSGLVFGLAASGLYSGAKKMLTSKSMVKYFS